MPDTKVKLVAEIDATSKGLLDALKQASGAVTNTTVQWRDKLLTINKVTDGISEHLANVSNLLEKAGNGALDTNAIQTELDALRSMQSTLMQTTVEMENLERASKQTSTATKDLGDDFGSVTDKVKIAGVSLKDLKTAFGDSAQSVAAMGAVYQQVFTAAINTIKEAKRAVDEANNAIARIEKLNKNIIDIEVKAQIEDTGKIASKMQELYNLREIWSGTEEEKARESILIDEIEWLQQQQKESDRIAVAINGQTIAQDKLRSAIADTLELEKQLKQDALIGNIDADLEKINELQQHIDNLDDVPSDFGSNLKRQLGLLAQGKISEFIDTGNLSVKTLSGFGISEQKLKDLEALATLLEKVKKEQRELQVLNQESATDRFFFTAEAKVKDRQTQATQTAEKKIETLQTPEEGRQKKEVLERIQLEYETNIKNGVSEEIASKLKNLQIEEFDRALAEAEAKKQAELMDAMQKRIEAYKSAQQKYITAENAVLTAKQKYADAEEQLAREARAERLNRRRQTIRNRLNNFGFELPRNFRIRETTAQTNRRVARQTLDSNISDKLQRRADGERVTWTKQERERLQDYLKLQKKDKSLEAAQKSLQAASKQERAADMLASASTSITQAMSAFRDARAGLREARANVRGGNTINNSTSNTTNNQTNNSNQTNNVDNSKTNYNNVSTASNTNNQTNNIDNSRADNRQINNTDNQIDNSKINTQTVDKQTVNNSNVSNSTVNNSTASTDYSRTDYSRTDNRTSANDVDNSRTSNTASNQTVSNQTNSNTSTDYSRADNRSQTNSINTNSTINNVASADYSRADNRTSNANNVDNRKTNRVENNSASTVNNKQTNTNNAIDNSRVSNSNTNVDNSRVDNQTINTQNIDRQVVNNNQIDNRTTNSTINGNKDNVTQPINVSVTVDTSEVVKALQGGLTAPTLPTTISTLPINYTKQLAQIHADLQDMMHKTYLVK